MSLGSRRAWPWHSPGQPSLGAGAHVVVVGGDSTRRTSEGEAQRWSKAAPPFPKSGGGLVYRHEAMRGRSK